MPHRPLANSEVQRLAQLARNTEIVSNKWPKTDEDLLKIAKAVERKDAIVMLDGERFVIRYESKFNAVFVKPVSGAFVPCGYFSYDKLNDAIARAKK